MQQQCEPGDRACVNDNLAPTPCPTPLPYPPVPQAPPARRRHARTSSPSHAVDHRGIRDDGRVPTDDRGLASPEMLLLWPPCDHGTGGEDARLEPLLRRADGSGQLAGVEVCGAESHEQACGRHPITHGLNGKDLKASIQKHLAHTIGRVLKVEAEGIARGCFAALSVPMDEEGHVEEDESPWPQQIVQPPCTVERRATCSNTS